MDIKKLNNSLSTMLVGQFFIFVSSFVVLSLFDKMLPALFFGYGKIIGTIIILVGMKKLVKEDNLFFVAFAFNIGNLLLSALSCALSTIDFFTNYEELYYITYLSHSINALATSISIILIIFGVRELFKNNNVQKKYNSTSTFCLIMYFFLSLVNIASSILCLLISEEVIKMQNKNLMLQIFCGVIVGSYFILWLTNLLFYFSTKKVTSTYHNE